MIKILFTIFYYAFYIRKFDQNTLMPRNTLTSFFLILGWFSFSQVVINELDADTPGTDQLEFIELKSASPNFPLDGYVLVFFNACNTASFLNVRSLPNCL